MRNDRLISGGIVVLILVVGALGWLLGVSPILDQTASAQAQRDSISAANTVTKGRIALLQAQYSKLDELQSKLDGLRTSIPEDASIPSFLAEINDLCLKNGVTLTSLTINDALVYVAPVIGPTAAPTPAPSSSSGTTEPTTPAVPTSPGSQLVDIPVIVVVTGPYSGVMSFSDALQAGTRLFLVSSFALTKGTAQGFSGELTGSVYALPLPAGQSSKPKPTSTPTPTPTPTVTSETPTPTPTKKP
jgi:Tfp pilus assembly protein PilO